MLFWRRLPARGQFTIYDRSGYGRVLVERVEGFAAPDAWRRAYGEISAFEEQLDDAGILVFKFWLQISPEEQLRRFAERDALAPGARGGQAPRAHAGARDAVRRDRERDRSGCAGPQAPPQAAPLKRRKPFAPTRAQSDAPWMWTVRSPSRFV
jgi:hypothetical protein